MTPERWDVIGRVFEAALELEPSRRAAFLDDACSGHPPLRAEVDSLLAANEGIGSFLEKPPLEAPPRPLRTPTFSDSEVISQRYQVVRFVAKGGMGEVYEARDLELDIPVALKTLLPDRDRSEAVIARFKREIQLARQVTHPNVCRVYDLGRCQHASQGDVPYLTMEFLNGETLARRIARAGRFSTEQALPVARQMVSALASAHKLGIIHRDFKSSNVMLVPNGSADCVKVTDFGLARSVSDNESTELTISGQVMGTPPYMAPEQFRGEATAASDIYALGVVMYEMVTGERPFQAGGAIEGRPAPAPRALVPDLNPRWDLAIRKCLKLDPAERFAKVEDVVAALEGTPEQETETYPRRRTPRRRFSRWVALGGAMLILALAAFALRGWIGRMIHPIPEQKHIAVLPFLNIGNDPNSQAFCEGLVETLTSKLSQLERYQKSFWVVPSSDVRDLKNFTDAYRNLNVTLVVTGSFQRRPDGVELIANLINAKDHKQLDSKRISVPATGMAGLADRLWERVADMLDLQVDQGITSRLAAGGTQVPGAYEFYEQGLGYVRRHGVDNFDRAIQLFERALTKDGSYALAYAGLAEAYSKKYESTKDSQWIDRARSNGEKAVRLDDELAPVHLALGQVFLRTGERDNAVKEFHRVLEIDPAAIEAHFYLGRIYEAEAKLQDAEDNFKTVVSRRPDYWLGYSGLGWFYFQHGEFVKAEKQFLAQVELQPDNSLGYENLGGLYIAVGKYNEAITVLKKAISFKETAQAYTNLGSAYMFVSRYADAVPAMLRAVQLSPQDHRCWRNLADSYRCVPGLTEKAVPTYRHALELSLKELKVNPKDREALSGTALYYAHLSDRPRALEWLHKGLAIAPNDNDLMFTSALIYELFGQRAQAIAALDGAWRAGYPIDAIEKEPELASLRKGGDYFKWHQHAQLVIRVPR